MLSIDSFLTKLEIELNKSHETKLVAFIIQSLKLKTANAFQSTDEFVSFISNTEELYGWIASTLEDDFNAILKVSGQYAMDSIIKAIMPASLSIVACAFEMVLF